MPEPIADIRKVDDAAAKAAAEKASAEAAAKAEADAKVAAEAKAKADADAAAQGKVGDILGGRKTSNEERTVPESVFLEIKKENQAVWTELKKVQDMIADGARKPEVSDALKKIGEKYKVDSNFLGEVASAIRAETEADIARRTPAPSDKKEEKKDEPQPDAAAEAERIDKIFNSHFDKTLEAMPEYRDVANRATVKSLTLLPENRDKTFAQILEAAYGHIVEKTGKRTMEGAKPGGGKEPAPIDYDKAAADTDYFKSIMADPALRKEYNANIHKRLKL